MQSVVYALLLGGAGIAGMAVFRALYLVIQNAHELDSTLLSLPVG